MSRRKRNRRQGGSLSSVLMVVAVPLAVGIGAFAVDMMKINSVHSELQKACDAGALAGTLQMYQFSPPPSSSFDRIVASATSATSLNLADGKPVANSTANTTVVVTIFGP